jgi:hypothetical protein
MVTTRRPQIQARLETEQETVGSGSADSTLGHAVKGAIAGAAATLAMDYVTWKVYLREDPEAFTAEKEQAQVHGKWGSHVAAEKLAERSGQDLSGDQRFAVGRAIHYMMGVLPGVAYALASRRFPQIRAGRGLLYGLGVFLVIDEMMGPMMGITSPPTKYPWQAHARGLIGHLALGAATDAALETLHRP